jgi:hypothetical protein
MTLKPARDVKMELSSAAMELVLLNAKLSSTQTPIAEAAIIAQILVRHVAYLAQNAIAVKLLYFRMDMTVFPHAPTVP